MKSRFNRIERRIKMIDDLIQIILIRIADLDKETAQIVNSNCRVINREKANQLEWVLDRVYDLKNTINL
jgi:hypothetical protein